MLAFNRSFYYIDYQGEFPILIEKSTKGTYANATV